MIIKTIHFVGIKGVGMTALAVMAKEAGVTVTGSDVGEQFITDITLQQAGISPLVGFNSLNVNEADLVITTGAHGGYENPEVRFAREKGIKVISMAEAVGQVMSGELLGHKQKGISVAGTHGKTTTSAIIATLLKLNGLDPSYFIGTSFIPSLGSSGHFGKGDYFVVEADEYATEPVFDRRPKFFWQNPYIAVFTNIELDHPDIYPSVDHVRKMFLQFAYKIDRKGFLVANGDDPEIQKVLREYNGDIITYGHSQENNYAIKEISTESGMTVFSALSYGDNLGTFYIKLYGEHNCLNALASIVVGLKLGLHKEQIQNALLQFSGTVRRLEYKGTLASGAILYDDYAHHPTEVKKTLNALKNMYRSKKIICIFQPHTYSRTLAFFDAFAHSFDDADEVILTEIYASAREEPDTTISSQKLASALSNNQKQAIFLPRLTDVVEYLDTKHYGDDCIVITMGAGNIYRVGDLVLK